jgi:hypothetical protein
LILLAASTAYGGSVLYVDDDAPPAGDGLSWATAYRFLQDALADAAGGGVAEIRVAQGVYTPDKDEANPGGDSSNCCVAHGGVGCDDAACEVLVCADVPLCCLIGWDINCAVAAADLCGALCDGPRLATFQLVDGVAVRGGYAGLGPGGPPDDRDFDLYEAILSGDLAGDDGPGDPENNEENAYNVVTASGTGASAVLEGFTITGGNADGPDDGWRRGAGIWNLGGSPTVESCRIVYNYARSGGGGMNNWEGSSPQVTSCRFEGNVANDFFGGGMVNHVNSNALVTDCQFIGNSAVRGGGIRNRESASTVIGCQFIGNSATEAGGGMSNSMSTTIVSNCSFIDNSVELTAPSFGGGMSSAGGVGVTASECVFAGNSAREGGAMFSQELTLTITGCEFSGNTASFGGVMENWMIAVATIVNCSFVANAAVNGADGFGGHGGAIYSSESAPTFAGCLFLGNTAERRGGALQSLTDSSPTVVNCTIVGNSADISGGANNASDAAGGHTTPLLMNCIVWGNSPIQIDDVSGSVTTVSYSNVEGGFPGTGNIDADPLFVDPDNGDYRLAGGSPSIDAADNAAVPGGVTTDLDGNPRFIEDLCREDTGLGNPPVDMGAYERQVASCDLDGDGVVGVTDFLDVLAFWGPCPDPCPPSCPADFDGDCEVGVNDFLKLLATWTQ